MTTSADALNPQPASEHTRQLHERAQAMVSFDDTGDFSRAQQGLIATIESGIVAVGDHKVWDVSRHDFVRESEAAPDTVHPGLWRQARLNSIHGLFEVADGVWQARGYDLSNITFIAGDSGWVIIDPLTTASTAAACLDLANATLGERPVRAVIYTHSHIDHFGGVLGVTTAEAVAAGDVRVIAPEGFLAEVVGENVIAGPAMGRRAAYQFGPLLPIGPMGQVDCGLGQAIPLGAAGLVAPTEEISQTGQELTVDGVHMVFQNTPDAEAPAEMNFFFPDKRLLCMAENCTHTLHNLYPIRGAQVRDSLAWSKYINEALALFGGNTDTMFASHHWPRFGADDVRTFLELQRDVYRWMHDSTMRLANLGYVPTEISAELQQLPSCFHGESHVQGYYGTVSHNVRSIYNRYLGWYDGNPANLDPLPPVESGTRYVELMGGAANVVERATESFAAGDYRWVVQLVNHVIFDDPTNQAARDLQANAFEQLGYQQESSTWRNAYLMGAKDLREGTPAIPTSAGRQIAHAMTVEQLFDTIGVRLRAEDFLATAGADRVDLQWHFTDLDEHHALSIGNAAISHHGDRQAAAPAATLTVTRSTVAMLLGKLADFATTLESGDFAVTGDVDLLASFFDHIEAFQFFPMVEP